MPTARDQILADIRRTLPVDAPLPELAGDWIRYDDPRQQFLAMLGGGVVCTLPPRFVDSIFGAGVDAIVGAVSIGVIGCESSGFGAVRPVRVLRTAVPETTRMIRSIERCDSGGANGSSAFASAPTCS